MLLALKVKKVLLQETLNARARSSRPTPLFARNNQRTPSPSEEGRPCNFPSKRKGRERERKNHSSSSKN